MEILYKRHKGPEELSVEPTRGSEEAAGWDLYAAETTFLHPFEPKLVATNLDVAVPSGHMLLVMPRSGNALKKQLIIPNSPGLIDPDYRGHLGVIMTYMPEERDTEPCRICEGTRIAQAVLVPYVTQSWREVDELPPTQRGRAGFGSTGS